MKIKLLFVLAIFIFGSCANGKNTLSNSENQNTENLTVSAAISLKDAFNEIGNSYKSKTNRKIDFNFGASGVLQQQIETGAPVDVFASAGERQMDELAKLDLIDAATRRDFARNALVLIVPQDSKSSVNSFSDLMKTEVRKIAAGNPKTVPAGQYAEESLTKMNLQNAVRSKLILAENVRQVLDYVARGEVDAGIVYATDALTAKENVRVIATADENSHAPILYPLAIIKNSRQKQAAQNFADFINGREGQAILRKYGFMNVTKK
ncbi:MAG: molybdate ABC transporter substrate-binding protein [Pyrinomonadaceae bacterium]